MFNNPLSANTAEWANTLFADKLFECVWSFAGLALKGLIATTSNSCSNEIFFLWLWHHVLITNLKIANKYRSTQVSVDRQYIMGYNAISSCLKLHLFKKIFLLPLNCWTVWKSWTKTYLKFHENTAHRGWIIAQKEPSLFPQTCFFFFLA